MAAVFGFVHERHLAVVEMECSNVGEILNLPAMMGLIVLVGLWLEL